MPSESSFFDSPLGNPLYKETEEKTLRSLKVGLVKEILPDHLYKIFEENRLLTGTKVSVIDMDRVIIFGQNNGIFAILQLEGRKPKQDSFTNPSNVLGYYYIDTVNQTAWDVAQLWNEPSDIKSGVPFRKFVQKSGITGRAELKHVGKTTSRYFPNGLGGIMHLGLGISEAFAPGSKAPLAKRQVELLENVSVMEEFAHKYQYHRFADLLEAGPVNFVGTFFINSILSKMPNLAKTLNIVPAIQKYLSMRKLQQREVELNAKAFSLRALRILRDQKLDLARGLTNTQVIDLIEWTLSTYDETFRYVAGKKFSRRRNSKR